MAQISHQSFQFAIAGALHRLSLTAEAGLYHVQMGQREFDAEVQPISPNCLSINFGGRFLTVCLAQEKGIRYISIGGRQFRVEDTGDLIGAGPSLRTKATQTSSSLVSPMPGQVVKIEISQGDVVERDQTLAIVEAMKMENELRAPFRARVKRIRAAPGDLVEAGQPIVELELET